MNHSYGLLLGGYLGVIIYMKIVTNQFDKEAADKRTNH